MQVADALLRADRDFELVVVPGGGHGIGERPDLVRRRQRFFLRTFGGR
jgi:dipeptidyl aminopeptidase/acylaminoacyl peptidase